MKTLAALVSLALAGVCHAAAGGSNTLAPPPPLPSARYLKVSETVHLHNLSPVAYFRVLLGMTPAQRDRALADRPDADRATILRKIREYEALPPEIREARLHQTELRWVLVSLMRIEPAQRNARLRVMSSPDRQWAEVRLRQWDTLPAAEQKAYLEKQDFISFYLRWQNASPVAQIEILSRLPDSVRNQWTAEVGRWQNMSAETRRQLCDQFGQLLTMDDQQRRAAVSGFNDDEKRQMEKSLQAYARLDPAQRRRCVESFGKFALMSPGDRADFLRNAARWEEMTPNQRRVWRQLVDRLPAAPSAPPLPPGFRPSPVPGLPPSPPGLELPAPTSTLAPKNIYAGSVTN